MTISFQLNKKEQKKQGYDLFNTCIKRLIRELSNRHPTVNEFGVCLCIYKILKTFNKRSIHAIFRISTDRHKSFILHHDDSFFMSPDMRVEPELQMFNYMVPMFQQCWSSMNKEEQDIIWQHIDVIMYLSGTLTTQADDLPNQGYLGSALLAIR